MTSMQLALRASIVNATLIVTLQHCMQNSLGNNDCLN